jgi:D-alanine transaminase
MSALPPGLVCYLNGEFTPLQEARVSVMDRGFIFGDGIYEVVPVYGGKPFCFDRHMARLERSLAAVRMANPLPHSAWRRIAEKLIATNRASAPAPGTNDVQSVYIQVTRGVAMRDHVMPRDVPPTVFVLVTPMKPPTAAQRANGVACVTADDFRWEKAHIKSTSLLAAVLARQISADADAAETVMFRDGYLSEGSASNVWVVKDGVLCGPARDHRVLEGVRYGLLEEFCQAAGIGFRLGDIHRDQVLNADELLLSSAGKEVLAVTQLDGKPVGKGRPGPIYQSLYAAYQEAKRLCCD